MNKKLTAFILTAAAALSLCGCSGWYNKEYVTTKDYVQSNQEDTNRERTSVKNFNALKQAMLSFAYAGDTEGQIVFDAGYDGDLLEDLASACWQVRTQDALCAYCVENIAYELTKIVTTNEASIYITYSSFCENADNIIHIPFSYGLESTLQKALENHDRKLVVLVSSSSYSAEEIESLLTKVYRENPTVVPKEPNCTVNMYSGTGSQRLYEISINYGLTAEELEQRMAALSAVDAFSDYDIDSMSDSEKALAACRYLMENCELSDSSSDNTAYAALVNHRANSEGMAFGYAALCRQLKLDCSIVYGQYMWQTYCWNIVKVDGDYYHVDAAGCISSGLDNSFLVNDENFWGNYRWDVASYPKCNGTLSYKSLNN
jgi:hypothetical protein